MSIAIAKLDNEYQSLEGHYVVTGLFGDSNEFGVYKAPRLPGLTCLFFSNSDLIGNYAESQGWRYVKTLHPIIENDRLETSLQSKWVKYLQFLNASPLMEEALKEPKSVLYFDHKFNVTSEHVANILRRPSEAALLIRKTPIEKESIQTEIDAAAPFERYSRHMEATKSFINNYLKRGAKLDVTICNTGLIHYRDLAISKKLADRVYDTCQSLKQPECQIVWAVHAQSFHNGIDVISWDDPLVADIEWQDPKIYTSNSAQSVAEKLQQPAHGIIIAGFHRSGTSSVAGLFHNSGISAGTDLVEETEDNAKGYFESWDLVNLHDRLMNSKGVDWATSLEQKAPLSEIDLIKLRDYFENRVESADGAWCMKDPRIGRYIFEWKRASPELKTLVLYRLPHASARSLQRRSMRDFVETRGTLELPRRFYEDPDFALRLWVEHNEAYVKFCEAYPEDCLVVGHAAVMRGFDPLEAVSENFGIDVPAQRDKRFLDSSLLSQPEPLFVTSADLRERAIAAWDALCAMDVSESFGSDQPLAIEDQLIFDSEGRLARGELLEMFAEAAMRELEARHNAAKDALWRAAQSPKKKQQGKVVNGNDDNLRDQRASRARSALLLFKEKSDERLNSKSRLSRDCKLLRKTQLFDTEWYLKRYPDVETSGMDPLEHYVRYGASEGRNPSSNFSTTKYLTLYEDVAQAGVNPLLHYAEHGRNEGR